MLIFLLACDAAEPDSGDTGAVYDRSPDVLTLTGDAANGESVFGGFCTSCHGYSGGGDIGPALADVVPGKTREHLVDVVLNGWDDSAQSSRMSGLSASITSDQAVADVVEYMLVTWAEAGDTGEDSGS